jgi:fructoselysine 6-kinase
MRLLGVGDNVVDRYHQLGMMFPGGQALNVAVAARRADAEAGYLGSLGTDAAGRVVLQALRAEGLDLERVRVVDGPNAYAEVELVDGNRVFVGSSEGVSRFSLSNEDLAYAATFDIAHSSESSFLEAQIPTLARHVRVSFDFSIRRDPAYLRPLLRHLTVACFSASDLGDEATEALLRHAIEAGVEIALATRGEADAMVCDRAGMWRQPVVRVDALDTLGAGDVFTGRFLVGVFSGEERRASLQAAAEVAARACEIYGAFGHGSPFESEEENHAEAIGAHVNATLPGIEDRLPRTDLQALGRE